MSCADNVHLVDLGRDKENKNIEILLVTQKEIQKAFPENKLIKRMEK